MKRISKQRFGVDRVEAARLRGSSKGKGGR